MGREALRVHARVHLPSTPPGGRTVESRKEPPTLQLLFVKPLGVGHRRKVPPLMQDAQDHRRAARRRDGGEEDEVPLVADRPHPHGERVARLPRQRVGLDAVEHGDEAKVVSEPLVAPPTLDGVAADVLNVLPGQVREPDRHAPDQVR